MRIKLEPFENDLRDCSKKNESRYALKDCSHIGSETVVKPYTL